MAIKWEDAAHDLKTFTRHFLDLHISEAGIKGEVFICYTTNTGTTARIRNTIHWNYEKLNILR